MTENFISPVKRQPSRYDQDAKKHRKTRNEAIIEISKIASKHRNMSGIDWSKPLVGSITDKTAVDAEKAAGKLITWSMKTPGLQSINQDVTVQVEKLQRANLELAASRGKFNVMDALLKSIVHLHDLLTTNPSDLWSKADEIYTQFG